MGVTAALLDEIVRRVPPMAQPDRIIRASVAELEREMIAGVLPKHAHG
jgi:hypothetical protein